MLTWTAEDYGSAMLFDRARSEGIVAGDSPSESLLRVAHLGFLVEVVDEERAVLVAMD